MRSPPPRAGRGRRSACSRGGSGAPRRARSPRRSRRGLLPRGSSGDRNTLTIAPTDRAEAAHGPYLRLAGGGFEGFRRGPRLLEAPDSGRNCATGGADKVATIEEAREAEFVRPDGKEKVTGAGRYTADLNLTGQAHAKFRYADHPHARILRIDASKARALPGVLAVVTHEDCPDVLYGGMVKDRRLFAKEKVRFEGDVVAAVAATTRRDCRACRRVDRGRLRAAAAGAGLRRGDGRGRPAGAPRMGELRGRRGPAPRSKHARLLDDRDGRRRRGARGRRRGREESLRHRSGAGGADRAARDHRRVAGRPSDRSGRPPRSRTRRERALPASCRSPSRRCA